MSHLATIAAMTCALCRILGMTQTSKTDAHHVRAGQGMSQRAGDFCVIPLCHETCHQGPNGVHGDRSLLKLAKVSEMDLLDMTIAELMPVGGNVPRGTARRVKTKAQASYLRSEKNREKVPVSIPKILPRVEYRR